MTDASKTATIASKNAANEKTPSPHQPTVCAGGIATRPTLTLDVSLYEEYLADSNLTEKQKREFLEALWSIIVAFVDLGFGVHPVQQALETECGSNGEIDDLSALIVADVLDLPDTEQSKITRAGEAHRAITGAEEES